MNLDPVDPFIQNPPEWEYSISDRDKRWLAALPVIQSQAQQARKHDILRRMKARRWFLIRNVHGFRCTRCSTQHIPVIHEFISVACLPCPFNGNSEPLARGTETQTEHGSIRGARVRQEETTRHARRLGAIEPITATQAKVYKARIRERTRQVQRV